MELYLCHAGALSCHGQSVMVRHSLMCVGSAQVGKCFDDADFEGAFGCDSEADDVCEVSLEGAKRQARSK